MRSFLVLLLACSASVHAQTVLSPPESETFALDGPAGTYAITVTLPPGYDARAAEPYPTLYYLDAWWLREMVTGTVRVAVTSETEVAPVVLVGIGFEGDQGDWTRQRFLDLTPGFYRSPFEGIDLPIDGVQLDSTNTGGAHAFFAFLESEVAPSVEARVHVDPAQRGLLGHSLGGLFGAWVLGHRPDFFNRYLLVSPAMWWRKGEASEANFAEARQLDSRVFVAVGASEGILMVDTKRELTDALQAESVSVTEREYPEGTHWSILPPAIWDGYVTLYGE